MATINTNERNAIIDLLMTVSGEDAAKGGVILDFLQTGLPGIAWATILRTRAANWQPYIESGLSISAFCDEIVRMAAVFASSRT